MEEKTDRRHTADEATEISRGSKEEKVLSARGYSLEQKFSDFVKISPDDTPPVSPDAKSHQRRMSEGCDTKLVAGAAPGKGGGSKAESDTSDDDIADREFEQIMRAPDEGSVAIAADPKARDIALGFGIDGMNMRDSNSKKLLWECGALGSEIFRREIEAHVPKEILECEAVSREIIFTSANIISKFRLEQKVYFGGHCIEEHKFNFGFVMPGSTNTWEQIIYAAPREKMMPAEQLSGHVTFETSFYDDKLFLCKVLFRIFYD